MNDFNKATVSPSRPLIGSTARAITNADYKYNLQISNNHGKKVRVVGVDENGWHCLHFQNRYSQATRRHYSVSKTLFIPFEELHKWKI